MSVKKRKGSPFYQYDFTVGGERFRGSCETDNYETAKAICAQLRADAALNRHLRRKPRITLDDAAAKYWKEHAQYTSSAATTKGHIRCLLRILGKHLFLDDLQDSDISRLVDTLRAGKIIKLKNGTTKRVTITNSTINRILEVLSAIIMRAKKRWGVEAPDIYIGQHKLDEPEARITWISPEQADKLIEAAADHLKAPIRCALLTGLRLGNIVGLQWQQIDFSAGMIRLRVKSRKPGRKVHELPITKPLFDLLQEQGPKAAGPVFLRHFKNTKRPADPRAPEPIKKFRRSFATACKRAELEDFRFHDLRHTAATWMRKKGVPIEDIKEVLGHSDIRMTMKYAHADITTKTRALDALADHMQEAS